MRRSRLNYLVASTGPSVALQETFYGFIMALIFVYAARFGLISYDGPVQFATIVICMNATWGAIDGFIFYFLGVCDQRRYATLITDDSIDRSDRINELMDEMGGTPLDVLSDEDKRRVCENMLGRSLQSEEAFHEDRRAMMKSSISCFIITMLTVIPVVVPVLLIPDFRMALTVASLLSTAVLFFVGYYMAKYIGMNRWITGFTFVAISLGISIISVFTGG